MTSEVFLFWFAAEEGWETPPLATLSPEWDSIANNEVAAAEAVIAHEAALSHSRVFVDDHTRGVMTDQGSGLFY